jgi:acetyl-CoA carboxylase alpha subunit
MDWQPLDFEKPIFELERRLQDLKNHSDAHDVDLDSAVKAVEEKLRETRREDLWQAHCLAARANRAAYAAAVRDGLYRTVLYKLD